VFACGADVSTDACPALRAGFRPVGAGDLHLGLGWPQVTFCLVLGERHGQVAGEAQRVGLPVAEAFQEVAGIVCASAGADGWTIRPGPRDASGATATA
jgi:hypothetical protein